MRNAILPLAVLGLLSALAPARINESRDKCIARYGEPAETVPTRLEKSEVVADVFKRPGLMITVEYRAGKAWLIIYSGNEVSKSNVEKLLARNAEDGGWKSTKFFDGEHWLAKNAGLHAVYYRTPGPRLVVMNEDALVADWKPRVAAGSEETGSDPGDPVAAPVDEPKPIPGKPDPLDGL